MKQHDRFFYLLIVSIRKWMRLIQYWINKIKKNEKTLPLFLAQAPSRSSRDGNGQFNYWHEIQIQSMHMALQIQTVASSSSILRIDHFLKRINKEKTIDINHFLKRIWLEPGPWKRGSVFFMFFFFILLIVLITNRSKIIQFPLEIV